MKVILTRRATSCRTRLTLTDRLWLAATLSVLLFATVSAQPEGCGTIVTPGQISYEKERAARFPAIAEIAEDDSTVYAVPLALHIIRQTDGTGGLDPADLQTALDLGNDLWAQSNIYAYQYGPIDFIDSDMFYFGTDNSAMYDFLRGINRVPEAINIYFLPNESGFPYCGLSSFTTSSTQGILMNNLCVLISGTSSTLVHEIGHYFDLYHTHETAFDVECPDSSNCTTAGDLICDTPADPNLNGHVSDPPDCEYDDFASPPAGCDATPYTPQTENIMSYSNKPCRDLYTPGQSAKMRNVLINDRTELAVTVGGVFAYPGAIDFGPAPLGSVVEDSVELTYMMTGTVDILSATSIGGNLTIGGTLPTTIGSTDTAAFSVTFDASGLTDECDRGVYFDTAVFTTTDTENPTLIVPVALTLGFVTNAVETDDFTTQCVSLTYDNTTGISEFSRSANDVLYDASLMVGVIDGSDTTVYRSIFGEEGFIPIDVISNSGGTGSFDIASNDVRIQGSVTYAYNSSDPDSCDFVYIDYELYNPCQAPVQIFTGLMGDFDLDNSGQNTAGFDDTRNTVFMTNVDSSRVAGMALLSDTPRNFRAVNNPAEVYSGFTTGNAYSHLESTTNTSGAFQDDWSIILSFGQASLAPGDTARYTAVLMYSVGGLAGLEWIYDKITGSATCCIPPTVGDVDQSGAVDITDISVLIDNQFLSLLPLYCFDEGDMDFSGAVDITDLSIIIDNQFLTLTPLPPCP